MLYTDYLPFTIISWKWLIEQYTDYLPFTAFLNRCALFRYFFPLRFHNLWKRGCLSLL